MSPHELKAFNQAVANVSLETKVLTPELIVLLKQSIERGLSAPEIIKHITKTA